MEDVIRETRKLIDIKCNEYEARTNPILEDELEKLADLHQKHLISNEIIDVDQVGLFDDANLSRTKQQKKSRIDQIFEEYDQWYTDTIKIEKRPYIRVVAVLKEV